MSKVLLVADRDKVIDWVESALSEPGRTVTVVNDPASAPASAFDPDIDGVLVDMRIDAMGAVAVTRAILDAAGDRQAPPITILLDREADSFLAKRAGATSWILKTAAAAELRELLVRSDTSAG